MVGVFDTTTTSSIKLEFIEQDKVHEQPIHDVIDSETDIL